MENLTARENLIMVADIRGVPRHLVQQTVERVISNVSLTEKAEAVSKTYSGKRNERSL